MSNIKRVNVVALRKGFYGGGLRRPKDKFTVELERNPDGSWPKLGSWMREISADEPIKEDPPPPANVSVYKELAEMGKGDDTMPPEVDASSSVLRESEDWTGQPPRADIDPAASAGDAGTDGDSPV